MKKTIFILFTLFTALCSKDFTVATYNVENLFDLTKQKTEYKEYVPNTKSNWNSKTFNIKLNNVVKVIKDIDADIIALQEVENKNILNLLFKKLPSYKYHSFSKYPRSAVGVGFLSKIKIKENKQIDVKFRNKLFRPILESTFELDNIEFKIFNNHWPSKRVAESYRVKYAKVLQDRLSKLPKDYDYILVGDFNSNYDEMISFRSNKKLNNTDGITGINQVLNTTVGKNFVTYDDVLKQKRKVHFNLWLDMKNSQRFSNKYRKQSNTPDNIILSPALLDTKKISYIQNSFNVFKPNYLYKNNKVNRWQFIGYKYSKKHKGAGYSDHLPIYAKFSTNKEDRNVVKKVLKEQKKHLDTIADLYTKEKLINPVLLKNVSVIYKSKLGAILKDKTRAIYIYSKAEDLKLGYIYDIQINQITSYNGLKEVKDFSILNKKAYNKTYKELYQDSKNIDISNPIYQNEIITNLKGIVKNKKLFYTKDKYVKLFAKNKKDLPKNGSKIEFKTAHLGVYKGNIQILIHSKNDYKEIN